MIQIKAVTKLYPAKETGNGSGKDNSSIHALDHISLDVTEGEWLSIMGPSGSGKSTLVNLIGCLDRPSSGEIWLDGQNVAGICAADLNRVRAEKIGLQDVPTLAGQDAGFEEARGQLRRVQGSHLRRADRSV